MNIKTRLKKSTEYNELFGELPNSKEDLIKYLLDSSNTNMNNVDYIKNNTIFKNSIKITLFEIPEGAKRPRARIINRKNISNLAISNPNFIHIYSPSAKEDSLYMKRLVNDDILNIKNLILTPCKIIIDAYFKTPSSFNNNERLLCEMGVILPLTSPDWDNIGKKYCDMFNSNIWLDDRLCVSGTVNKFYSIKPRIEITLLYTDNIYTKKQAKSISKSSKVELSDLSYLI